MKSQFQKQISEIQECLKQLARDEFSNKINYAARICNDALSNGLPILVCGNGGSAADAQHIAGELVCHFLRPRRALNVRSLSCDTSVITAWANDVDFSSIFSRQVEAYGSPGGVLIAISTSGNSLNIVNAVVSAKKKEMAIVGLTGESGGDLKENCTVCINVPAVATPRIQEMHMIVYHHLCELIEKYAIESQI
jgi:D-sedoheptulose 7-phosphate isomerase